VKITDVVLFKVTGHMPPLPFPRGDRASRPLDVYPEFNAPAPSSPPSPDRPRSLSAIYVEVLTDEGVSGLFGPIQEAQAYVIQRSLKPFLLGRDPLANELLLDLMLRLDRHGRSGLFMTGISPVDCALWDLKGKAWNQPVYRLLGGPTRPSVPAYASMLGFSLDPAEAARTARDYQAKGYTAQKWFFRHGPGDGEIGKGRNLATARAIREAVGPDYELMFDAVMGWDASYAIDMVRRLEPLNPTWMEEPIPPERVGAFRRIQEAAGFPIATGEHVYTRWQVKELLAAGAVRLLQTDPDWTGGITELVKICALASAFETPVVAHGHSLLAALHVAGAQSPTTVPRVEYLVQAQEAKQFFHRPVYRPEAGAVRLPDLPGLGLVLDESKVESRTPVEFKT
jgi:L-alanine-DL-glutamate epimerase-like enolase superfamily enzyme